MITLRLPCPPSMNTYWRNFRGRTVLSKKGREFKQLVQEYVIDNQVPKFGDQRLSVIMVFRPRDKRVCDIDNRIKPVLDALQDAGVYDDDSQIDHLEMSRGLHLKGGGIVVFIGVIKPHQLSGESLPSAQLGTLEADELSSLTL